MGQLTVGILFFKSPRPTGWLGEIGVRHWPHRFPSCGLNQLWLLASLSLSLSFPLSVLSRLCLFLSAFSFSFSFHVHIHLYLYLLLAHSRFSFTLCLLHLVLLVSSLSFDTPRYSTTYTFYFIPFHYRSHHAFNILRPTLIGRYEITRICHWTRKSNGGRPLSLSLLDVSPFQPPPPFRALFSSSPWFPSRNLFTVSMDGNCATNCRLASHR